MGLDIEKLRKAQQELQARMARGGGSPSLKFWRPSEGANTVRILPAWTQDGPLAGQFWREVHQHWNLVEDSGPVLCPKKTPYASEDKECPICDLVDELRDRKTDVQAQELLKNIRAKVAYLMSIIDMRDAAYTAKDVAEWSKDRPGQECPFSVGDPKVRCYAATTTISEQIFGIITSNGMDITDRFTGHNIILTKIGNKDRLKTRYTVTPDLKATKAPIPEDFQLPDLSAIGQVKPFDELMKLLSESSASSFLALPSGSGADSDSNSAWGLGSDDGDDLAARMRAQLGQ
ncbi:hypothetical protein HC928_02660 [bacterium]|nr:hypothetical protein [bacterium]